MLVFILIAFLLIFFSVVTLILPLLRAQAHAEDDRDKQNIEHARERLTELNAQLSAQEISSTDYQSLKRELENTLAYDLDLQKRETLNQTPAFARTSNAVLITLVCCLVPVVTTLVYLLTGDPEAIVRHQIANIQHSQPSIANPMAAEIGELVTSLETRLQTEPEDIQGWTILARTYRQLNRNAESAKAYRRLIDLQPTNADVYAGLADALAATLEGSQNQEARAAISQALSINPNHPQSLWLQGVGFLQNGDPEAAIQSWQKLVGQLQDFPDQQAELQNVITETSRMAKAGGAPQAESEPINNSSESDGLELKVSVAVADELLLNVSPEDTVYVIVKAEDGPPAPLAVKRLSVSQLPATLSLTESDGMIPQLSIANFQDLLVVARVSRSGQPSAQAGDLESSTIATSNRNQNLIKLIINRTVD